MNYIKTINQLSNLTLLKWLTNPKIYILFCLMMYVIFDQLSRIMLVLTEYDLKISPFILSLLVLHNYVRLALSFGIILLFCDAPFKTQEHIYIIVRANKTTWVLGQVLYIAKASFIYFGILSLFSIFLLLPYADFTTDWSEGLALYQSADNEMRIAYLNIGISEKFSACWAFIHTFSLFVLVSIFIGLIMFCINTITAKFVGVTVCTTLVLTALMKIMFGNWFLWVLPTNLTDLNILDPVGTASGMPKLWYAYMYLIALILILIWLSVRVTKKNLLGGAV